MTTIPVAVYFDRLFCFQGSDEDGESEPYLWVIMAKIDGSCIFQNGNALTGTPATFFSQGSHGNIGSGILPGFALNVPPAVGLWQTTLQPVILTDPLTGAIVEVPGSIVAVAILLEENSTPDDAIEAGHTALNNFVVSQLTEVIGKVDLMKVAETVAGEVANGADRAAATEAAIQALIKPAIDTLKSMAKPVVVNTIIGNLGIGGILETILSFGDVDNFLGTVTHTYSQTDLANTATNGAADGLPPIHFNDTIADTNQDDRWQFDYTLGSYAWRTVEEIVTPIPYGVNPGRWQVTAVEKAHSATSGLQIITAIAGPLADGTFWWVTEDDAMNRIAAGTNSFFVVGADGSEADVVIGNALPIGRSYLTTTPDASKADNLSNLPAFWPFVQSEKPDP